MPFEKKTILSEVEGWLSPEVADLLASASLEAPEGIVLEIGAWKGRSTIILANASPSRIVHSIDPFTGSQEHEHVYGADVDTWAEFEQNLKRFEVSDRVISHQMTSQEAEISESIAVLWIDGSHEYKDVKLDFHKWFDQVVPGGWILFHDSKWQGVKKVLWEEFIPHPLVGPVERLEDTTFARKLKTPNSEVYGYNQQYLKLQKEQQRLKKIYRKLNKVY